jgi:uncharacterized membrane protein
MGAFIYVFLVFLVTHQDAHSSFIPQVSLITSWFLVLGAFGFLVFYSHRVAVLIQNPDAIGRIVDDLRRAAEVANRDNRGRPRVDVAAPSGGQIRSTDSAPVLSPASGYLQEIDHPALVSAASRAGALISIPFRPGQFILEGEVLATISPSTALPVLTPLAVEKIELGRHRVLAQDLEFGIAQIVEIAIHQISEPGSFSKTPRSFFVDLLGMFWHLLIQISKLGTNRHQNRHQSFSSMKKPLGLRGFGLRNLFILLYLSWCREGGSNPHEVALGGF